MFAAIEKGNDEIVKLLLKSDKLDINKTYKTEKLYKDKQKGRKIIEITALQCAINNNQDKIIQYFLSKEFSKSSEKIDLNKKSIKAIINNEITMCEKTPLYMAIEKRNVNAIKLLLARTDININDKSFFNECNNQIQAKTALHLAAEKEDIEIIKLLLEMKEIVIDIDDFQGKKPIDYSQNDEITKLLS